MDVEVSQREGTTVVTVLGSPLDASNAERFKQRLATLVDGGVTRLVLDLSELRFIDSSGLGAIIATLKHIAGGVTLVLDPSARAVNEVFRLTRVDHLFRIVPSVDAALAPAGE
jgi:anti-sigma B factor antagonist